MLLVSVIDFHPNIVSVSPDYKEVKNYCTVATKWPIKVSKVIMNKKKLLKKSDYPSSCYHVLMLHGVTEQAPGLSEFLNPLTA